MMISHRLLLEETPSSWRHSFFLWSFEWSVYCYSCCFLFSASGYVWVFVKGKSSLKGVHQIQHNFKATFFSSHVP